MKIGRKRSSGISKFVFKSCEASPNGSYEMLLNFLKRH